MPRLAFGDLQRLSNLGEDAGDDEFGGADGECRECQYPNRQRHFVVCGHGVLQSIVGVMSMVRVCGLTDNETIGIFIKSFCCFSEYW